MAAECRRRRIPFIIDAAQSAGAVPIDFAALGAEFIAMPGHKGLLGPMGTGLLLCARVPKPLLMGGTGSESESMAMPPFLPDRGEAGTLNVSGFAGLTAGLRLVREKGPAAIGKHEAALAAYTAGAIRKLGFKVFSGPGQLGTLSFRGQEDCQILADRLAERGIALRSGLHCAPLAHRSAGTLETGTVRVSFGWDSRQEDTQRLLAALEERTG
jgi:selenocysteine lyase/cysteine desulfurase